MAKVVKPLEATTITQLQNYAAGQVVELPPFAEGQPFYARLRRPSMMVLVKSGKIPNSLIKTANSLFLGSSVDNKDERVMGDMFAVLDALCEASFVEPTYSEIQAAGIELTDDQMMFIFNYTQHGIKALDSFRSQPKFDKGARTGAKV